MRKKNKREGKEKISRSYVGIEPVTSYSVIKSGHGLKVPYPPALAPGAIVTSDYAKGLEWLSHDNAS